MYLSRIVIRNYRSLKAIDVSCGPGSTVLIGENNVGKSNLFQALRICLDVQLSSTFRSLLKEDIHCEVDQTAPFQVLIGVEFSGFQGHENEEALLHGAEIGDNRARLFYRFRPKRTIREALGRAEYEEALTLDDYGWELSGGGNPTVDLMDIEWDDEVADIGGVNVGLQYLQSYLVVFLPALRDVEADLQTRRSSLARLIDASQIDLVEQEILIAAIKAANQRVERSPPIRTIASAIDDAFKEITGPAFSLDVGLGLSSPTFQSIIRNLIVLLSNDVVTQFEPRRNGLGLNNILYIAILVEYFRRRSEKGKAAGELILVEEPEAHLHPQLQSTLIDALRSLPFQSLVSTHSTQITAKVPLSAYIVLTTMADGKPFTAAPAVNSGLSPEDLQDLNRYLDATKSNLLFARKVMLVEGASELLLLPPLVQRVIGIDLEREGISVVAVHGAHFAPYARLFSATCLPKPCAIVGDADQDADAVLPDEDLPMPANLDALAGPFVQVFLGATTFEREITTNGNLKMLAVTAEELGAPRLKDALEVQELLGGPVPEQLKAMVLRTAKRFGKARFAQVAARHVSEASDLPEYIVNAVEWLRAQ